MNKNNVSSQKDLTKKLQQNLIYQEVFWKELASRFSKSKGRTKKINLEWLVIFSDNNVEKSKTGKDLVLEITSQLDQKMSQETFWKELVSKLGKPKDSIEKTSPKWRVISSNQKMNKNNVSSQKDLV